MNDKSLIKRPPQVPVEIEEKFPNEDEAIQALKRCGMAEIGASTLADIGIVGQHVKGVGVVKLMRGAVMVTHQRLESAMRMVHEEMGKARGIKSNQNRVTAISKLSHGLGYLAARQADAFKSMMDLQGGKPAPEPGGDFVPTNRSFAAGSEVKPNQTLITGSTVYLNSAEAPATAK